MAQLFTILPLSQGWGYFYTRLLSKFGILKTSLSNKWYQSRWFGWAKYLKFAHGVLVYAWVQLVCVRVQFGLCSGVAPTLVRAPVKVLCLTLSLVLKASSRGEHTMLGLTLEGENVGI